MAPVPERRISLAVLESVLDALAEPVIVTDADGVVTLANAAARRLGAEKHLGAPIVEEAARRELFDESEQPLAPAQHPVARVLATRSPLLGARLSIRRPAGPPMVGVVNCVPLMAGGRLVGTVSTFQETAAPPASHHDQTDHAVRLEAMVNLVDEGVFVVGGGAELMYCNAQGHRLLDLPPAASLEERARRLRPRDEDGRPVPPARLPSIRALAGETVAAMPLIVDNAAGETRHLIAHAHPLRRPDGQIYAALVTTKDVTDEVRGREELEAARTIAEEANHLKDEFIAALSHELRTPLQPILGWTEVLRRHGNLDAVTTQALEAIRRNIRQQVRLVDDLLDLSRIVHGKLALRFETFDLREQVRAAAEPFEEAAALKRIRLTLNLPPEPIPMWGDGARVQQIAANLISNAVKFTPAGGLIAVQLVATESEALLEIEDTGEGIAPDELAVIFEPFGQGASSRRRGGLGIGLNLVKRLVELHGGSVDVSSEGRGYGSLFRVRLPLSVPTMRPVTDTKPAARRLDRCSVLIIEDNADTRAVMKFMLEAEGARVETAESGQSGLDLARQRGPNVILCDIGLPDIDGLEVARRLRRLRALDGTRLIALTGYGQPEDVQHAFDAGFEAHLTKPINLDQLLSLLGPEAQPHNH
jgi:signal transduction histidine kinase/ActR/RegA family two-component response regulator